MSNSKIVSACAALARLSYDLPPESKQTIETQRLGDEMRELAADARDEYDALTAQLRAAEAQLEALRSHTATRVALGERGGR